MQKTCVACGIAGAVAIVLSSLAWAQLPAEFQPPTEDELKMTSDPKAPGAAAVYLNVEEITNDPVHFYSVYARIKVLQEKGKELATVVVPYVRHSLDQKADSVYSNRVTDIKARTIHPDGTIVPLAGKPQDILNAKEGQSQIDRVVFTLPSVEVGSILEYGYQVRYGDNWFSSPTWEVQRPYFVHKAHYAFTPFPIFVSGAENRMSHYLVDENGLPADTLLWNSRLPAGVTVKRDVQGRFTVDVADVPPVPHEDWMPPLEGLLYKVAFYYKHAADNTQFWIEEIKRWSKEVDHFAEPSPAIRAAVGGLIAPGDSDQGKAQKLYQAVQALDNADFSRKRGPIELRQLGLKTAKRAEDTWTQKSGSGQDIALLYLAMLRAAGLRAYDLKVADRAERFFDPTYLRFNQLEDDLIVLKIGTQELMLDPGEKMCPFGMVHWRHAGASGVRQDSDGRSAALSPLLTYMDNTLYRSGDLTIDAHGSVSGTLQFIMTGQEALSWRQSALRNDEDEVRKQFDRWLERTVPAGVQGHLDHFLGIDDAKLQLIAVINVRGSLGTATAKRVLLPGFFFQSRGSYPFVNQEKREAPIDMEYAETVTDQLVYHLPAGFVVEGAPQDSEIPWPQHAVLVVKSAQEPGKITIARQLSRAFTFAGANEYQDLRGFYQKMAAADQQQLVLTAAPPAAQGR
jgi:hypothetical protein